MENLRSRISRRSRAAPRHKEQQRPGLAEGGGLLLGTKPVPALGGTKTVPTGPAHALKFGVKRGAIHGNRLTQRHQVNKVVAAALAVEPGEGRIKERSEVERGNRLCGQGRLCLGAGQG